MVLDSWFVFDKCCCGEDDDDGDVVDVDAKGMSCRASETAGGGCVIYLALSSSNRLARSEVKPTCRDIFVTERVQPGKTGRMSEGIYHRYQYLAQ
jgi:hypothetical protein